MDQRTPMEGGRGEVFLFTFGGVAVVAREYLHGGLRERVLRRHFLAWPPRPIWELAITEEARKRGIQTPEILGARVCWSAGPFYEGAILTRYLDGSKDLWAWLKEVRFGSVDREELLLCVGRFLKSVHDAGVYHRDLNLRNLLIRSGPGNRPEIFLIDLDRGSIRGHPLAEVLAKRNMRRFSRSARKLDPGGATVTPADLDVILHGYRATREGLALGLG